MRITMLPIKSLIRLFLGFTQRKQENNGGNPAANRRLGHRDIGGRKNHVGNGGKQAHQASTDYRGDPSFKVGGQ